MKTTSNEFIDDNDEENRIVEFSITEKERLSSNFSPLSSNSADGESSIKDEPNDDDDDDDDNDSSSRISTGLGVISASTRDKSEVTFASRFQESPSAHAILEVREEEKEASCIQDQQESRMASEDGTSYSDGPDHDDADADDLGMSTNSRESPLTVEGVDEQRRRHIFWKQVQLFSTGFMLIVGVTCLFGFLAVSFMEDSENNWIKDVMASNQTTNTTTTPAPSTEAHILSLFPAETVTAIRNDPQSPQYYAYQWMLQDPFISNYTDWRILQRFGLAALYFSTNGPSWYDENSIWLSYDHECMWLGLVSTGAERRGHLIPCGIDTEENDDRTVGSVRHLWLSGNNLDGVLPSELFFLTDLQTLSFYNNSIYGSIPSLVGELRNLEELVLASNLFTSSIPSELALLPSLQRISLSNNSLTGTIPTEFVAAAQSPLVLKHFDIRGNPLLTSYIPDQFCGVVDPGVYDDYELYNREIESGILFDCSATLCGCDCECSMASSKEAHDDLLTSNSTLR
jgi:Leucine-rich repeat (LRR) protein